jgi:hypothetical protein
LVELECAETVAQLSPIPLTVLKLAQTPSVTLEELEEFRRSLLKVLVLKDLE